MTKAIFSDDARMRARALTIKVGDLLTPIALWQSTAGRSERLPTSAEVLAVRHGNSQTGVLVTVRTAKGARRELDAAWFAEVAEPES